MHSVGLCNEITGQWIDSTNGKHLESWCDVCSVLLADPSSVMLSTHFNRNYELITFHENTIALTNSSCQSVFTLVFVKMQSAYGTDVAKKRSMFILNSMAQHD